MGSIPRLPIGLIMLAAIYCPVCRSEISGPGAQSGYKCTLADLEIISMVFGVWYDAAACVLPGLEQS